MNNSDLKQFDLGTQQAKNVVELQKSQFYPVLTSSFNYTYMSQNNDYKFKDYRWDPYSVVGISLAIPLFNGGQRYHNLKQSKIQVLQLQEQRKDLEQGLKLQIKNNMDLINKNIEQIIATQSSIQQAQKGYEITVKRYETGLGTIVDVNAAALAVTNAQLQYRNAIYDYLAAKTDLEKVLGYSVNPYETESNK
jgi:outer membrane protein TolC